MGIFDDMFDALVTASDLPAETCAFTQAPASARNITVLVDRRPPEALPEDAAAVRPNLRIMCANSATSGVALSTLDTSIAVFSLPRRAGCAAENLKCQRIVNQSPAVLMLELV